MLSFVPWRGCALPGLDSARHTPELKVLGSGDGGFHRVGRPVLDERPRANAVTGVLDAENHRYDVSVLGKLKIEDASFLLSIRHRIPLGQSLSMNDRQRPPNVGKRGEVGAFYQSEGLRVHHPEASV